MIRARLEPGPLAPPELLREFLSGLGGAQGAVVSFAGLTRRTDAAGNPVDGLFLDHHPRLSEASLHEIAEAAAARFSLGAVEVVHRAGQVAAGEPIVWVAAAAAHRRAAFDAVDFMMDRLKSEAVLWKREDGEDESSWIEPTAADRAALDRWREED